MKKVYVNPIGTVIAFFLFFINLEMAKEEPSFISKFLPYGLGVMAVGSIILNFLPTWKYSRDGLSVWRLKGFFKGGWRDYSWNQVKFISSTNLSSYTLLSVADSWIVMGEIATRDYLLVLSEVVSFIRKNNKHAYVSPRVLERVETKKIRGKRS